MTSLVLVVSCKAPDPAASLVPQSGIGVWAVLVPAVRQATLVLPVPPDTQLELLTVALVNGSVTMVVAPAGVLIPTTTAPARVAASTMTAKAELTDRRLPDAVVLRVRSLSPRSVRERVRPGLVINVLRTMCSTYAMSSYGGTVDL